LNGAYKHHASWPVRAGPVFPLVSGLGCALLLTDSLLARVKEELWRLEPYSASEFSAVMAGWSRWLEVRREPEPNQVALCRYLPRIGLVCFVFIGAILLKLPGSLNLAIQTPFTKILDRHYKRFISKSEGR
jgi:hypothetical protein